MDLNALNTIGYFEIIEISLYLAVMYTGKSFIDEFFNRRLNWKQQSILALHGVDLVNNSNL